MHVDMLFEARAAHFSISSGTTAQSYCGQAVLGASGNVPEGTPVIQGWDPNTGADLDGIMAAMFTSGFQATSLGQAIAEVNRMVRRPHRNGSNSVLLMLPLSPGTNASILLGMHPPGPAIELIWTHAMRMPSKRTQCMPQCM